MDKLLIFVAAHIEQKYIFMQIKEYSKRANIKIGCYLSTKNFIDAFSSPRYTLIRGYLPLKFARIKYIFNISLQEIIFYGSKSVFDIKPFNEVILDLHNYVYTYLYPPACSTLSKLTEQQCFTSSFIFWKAQVLIISLHFTFVQ